MNFTGCVKTKSHDLKCQVFKNNYGRLREGFRSNGFSAIKGFLYSKDIINAETRDAHDVEKVLSDVEIKLKFSETTWETLLSGMSEPPLDVLCAELRRELEIELSKDHIKITETCKHTIFTPPKSLPISDELKNKKIVKDSGCGSTNTSDTHINYPTGYFDQSPTNNPTITPTNSTRSSTSRSISSYLSTSSTDSTDQVYYTESKPPYTDATTDSGVAITSLESISDILSENIDYSEKSSILSPHRNSSNESGYENSLAPIPASSPITSELVNSLNVKKSSNNSNADSIATIVESGGAEMSIHEKIENLRKENDALRHDKKRLVDQIKELEEDNNYLMEKRKEDQQLLEYKMIQVARENEILERKQEFIRRLENENREFKKGLKTGLSQQELLMKRNEELMFRIQLAERSTSLSAITIDQLKQDIATRNTVIEQLRQEISQYRDWYATLNTCSTGDDKESSDL